MNNKNLHTIEFKLKKLLDWGLFGNFKSRVSGAWMEFLEHSKYNLWDEAKDIDWKASSKTGELYMKKYEVEKDLNVLFVLDTSETMRFGSENKIKLETLTETFYVLALSAYYNNDNIWAIIYKEDNLEFIDYKKSKNNIYRILEKISPPLTPPLTGEGNRKKTLPPERGELEGGLSEIKKRKIKNNLIFILTDKQDFDLKKLRFLSENNDIVLINIFDRFENELISPPLTPPLTGEGNKKKTLPPEMGGLEGGLSINLWKDFLNINLWDNKKQEEFRKLRKNKIKKIKYDLEKNNIWYIFLDNKSDILKELVLYFNKIK